jgi:MraZ protein
MDEWERFEEKIDSLPTKQARQLQLFFIASAHDCEIDAQGRVLVPQKLREYAGLSKNVIVAGMTNYIEIWDEDEWNKLNLTPDSIADIMEAASI